MKISHARYGALPHRTSGAADRLDPRRDDTFRARYRAACATRWRGRHGLDLHRRGRRRSDPRSRQGRRPHSLLMAKTRTDRGIVERMWWRLHYGGRGGSVSSRGLRLRHRAVGPEGAPAWLSPLWRLLGGFDPAVPCYAGGIDLEFTAGCVAEADRRQPRQGLPGDQDEGRPSAAFRGPAGAGHARHLGDDFPLMADANMRWTRGPVDRAARAFRDSNLTWLEEPTIPDDVAGHTRIVREGGVPVATGENLHTLHEFTQMIAAGGVTFREPDVTNCGGVTVFMKVAHLAEALQPAA